MKTTTAKAGDAYYLADGPPRIVIGDAFNTKEGIRIVLLEVDHPSESYEDLVKASKRMQMNRRAKNSNDRKKRIESR